MTPGSIVYYKDNMIGMAGFADKQFDIAIVDPPYGINAPNMQMGQNLHRKGKGQYSGTTTAVRLKKGRLNQDWDKEKPTPEYFKELFRVSKNQIIFGGNYFNLPPTRCIICWDKCQPWDNFSQWEMAWTSFDMPAKMYRVSNTGGANKEPKIHPTQKPIALYDLIYRDFVKEGMKVLDTHLGSGSHRITAYKAGIDFTGFENDILYFDGHPNRSILIHYKFSPLPSRIFFADCINQFFHKHISLTVVKMPLCAVISCELIP